MGSVRVTPREKLYQKLGLEALRLRHWYRKPFFYKVFKSKRPQYLFHVIPVRRSSHSSRNVHSIPIFNVKHCFFKIYFLLSTISEWNKLNFGLHHSEGLLFF